MSDAKVAYRRRDGGQGTAYVDEETGDGVDKHTDIPVQLRREAAVWVQIDRWEWEWKFDHFERIREGNTE